MSEVPANRTRRRAALWLIVGLVLLAPPAIRMIRSIQTSDYLPRRFTGAPGEEIGRIVREGPVQVILLDARRLGSGEAGLHLVITADGLSATEELVAQPGLSGSIEVVPAGGYSGGPPPPPPQMITAGRGTALEAWLALAPGIQRISFDVAALLASRVSGPGPPPLPPNAGLAPPLPPHSSRAPAPPHTPLISRGPVPQPEARSCAVPVNEFDQCGLFEDEGRHLATIRLDMSALGVPAWIWRSPAD